MKTSRAQRLEEWSRLDMLAINGQLTVWTEVRRWCKLRKEFAPGNIDANRSKTPEKG